MMAKIFKMVNVEVQMGHGVQPFQVPGSADDNLQETY